MPRRRSIDNDLSRAQAARAEMRADWMDGVIEAIMTIALWLIGHLAPQLDSQTAQLRAQMQARLSPLNAAYVASLDAADERLIDRVTAILMNEQIVRAEQIEALERRIAALEAR